MLESGDWSRYGEEFTQEATLRRSGVPHLVGRDQIAAYAHHQMTTFPGNQVARLEVAWVVVDPVLSVVVYELVTVMRDAGDGSELKASTTTSLTYAGNGLWSAVVDAHNPDVYEEMAHAWSEAAQRSGILVLADDRG